MAPASPRRCRAGRRRPPRRSAGAELMQASGVDLPALVVCDPRAVLGAVAALVYANAGPGGAADIGLTLIGVTGPMERRRRPISSRARAAPRHRTLASSARSNPGVTISGSRVPGPLPRLRICALIRDPCGSGVGTCVMEVSSHASLCTGSTGWCATSRSSPTSAGTISTCTGRWRSTSRRRRRSSRRASPRRRGGVTTRRGAGWRGESGIPVAVTLGSGPMAR